MIKRFRKYIQVEADSSKGLTLVELLIVMSLISFIMAIGYSMYSLGAKTYTIGINHSDAQFECRKAVQFISEQVRTAAAGKVSINNNTDFDNISTYIYVDTDTHLLMYKRADSDAVVKAGIDNEVKITNIEFTCPTDGILGIYIETSCGDNEKYHIETEVKLLNESSNTTFKQNTTVCSRIQIKP